MGCYKSPYVVYEGLKIIDLNKGVWSAHNLGFLEDLSAMRAYNDLPYNSPTYLNNDWVIAKLSSPLELNSNVQAACLPTSGSYFSTSFSEERCFTSGWGTLSSGLS